MKNLPEVGVSQDIIYFLHDPHDDPRPVSGTLVRLVYDIPYFGACGVFPPLHVANQWFAHGGGDAGMNPGASWEPFRVSRETYRQLSNEIENTDPADFHDASEIFRIKFIFDTSFDQVQDRFAWARAVCRKHRASFLERLEGRIVDP